MKIKTQELTGAALDWAVAKCEGIEWEQGDLDAREYGPGFKPSTDWAQGGPIIERESIALRAHDHDTQKWEAQLSFGSIPARQASFSTGPTPLIAAMRCFCCAKLGNEIDIPEELCQQQNS